MLHIIHIFVTISEYDFRYSHLKQACSVTICTATITKRIKTENCQKLDSRCISISSSLQSPNSIWTMVFSTNKLKLFTCRFLVVFTVQIHTYAWHNPLELLLHICRCLNGILFDYHTRISSPLLHIRSNPVQCAIIFISSAPFHRKYIVIAWNALFEPTTYRRENKKPVKFSIWIFMSLSIQWIYAILNLSFINSTFRTTKCIWVKM